MCGIIGVIGNEPAAPLLINGLKRLAYRGYDSAGIATIIEGLEMLLEQALIGLEIWTGMSATGLRAHLWELLLKASSPTTAK